MILDGLVKGIYDMFSFDNKNTMLEKHDFSLFGVKVLLSIGTRDHPVDFTFHFCRFKAGHAIHSGALMADISG